MATSINSEADLVGALKSAGGKLVVVDFWATWCGPCVKFAPTYDQIAKEYTSRDEPVIFLKVESKVEEAHSSRGIRAVPTFKLYLKSAEVDSIQGAGEAQLRAAIEKHKKNAISSWSGAGLTLGGGGKTLTEDEIRLQRLARLGGGGGGGAGGGSAAAAPPVAPTVKPTAASTPAVVAPAIATAPVAPPPTAPAVLSAPTVPSVPAPRVRAVFHCDDCGTTLPTHSDVSTHATRTGHGNYSQVDGSAENAAAGGGASGGVLGGDAAGGSRAAPPRRKRFVDAAAVETLEAMSFPRVRAIKALMSTSSGNGIEAACEWLAAHQDDADIDVAVPDDAVEIGTRADVALTAEESEVSAASGGKKLTAEELAVKIKELREAKAIAAKEAERLSEIKRREDGKKSIEAEEAMRKQRAMLEADQKRREKLAFERERLRQKLELCKEKAERQSKAHGKPSDEVAAELIHLQKLWDGEHSVLVLDPRVEIPKKVNALTMQKLDSIGMTAANFVKLILANVLKAPSEDKFRRVPWVRGKKAFDSIMPAPAGLPLLETCGWKIEEAADGTATLVLHASVDLALAAFAVEEITKAFPPA